MFTLGQSLLCAGLHRPWKVNSPGMATGTGFHIGNRRILTNNHVIEFGTSIRVRRHGVPGNFEAVVLCGSAVCDLAIVTVESDEFWNDIPVAQFQDEVRVVPCCVALCDVCVCVCVCVCVW